MQAQRPARPARWLFAAALAGALLSPALSKAGDEPPAPRRIVSLNLCADELLLRLADRDRIASVTWLARQPGSSTVAAEAAGLPVNRGLAEEIVPLDPDLVIAGAFTTRTAVSLLKRLNIPLLELGVPQSVEGVVEQIRTVASAVGEPDRGERVIAAFRDRLAAVPAPAGKRPKAVVLWPNGFVTGPGTLVDELIRRAGLANLAESLPGGGQEAVPLEAVLLGDADMLILDTAPDAPPSLAHAWLHHPAVAALKDRLTMVSMPSKLWTCPGPQIADALAILADARRDLAHHSAPDLKGTRP